MPEAGLAAELSAEPAQAAGRAAVNPVIVPSIEADRSSELTEQTPNRAAPVRTRRVRALPANQARRGDEPVLEGSALLAEPPGASESVTEAAPSAVEATPEVPAELPTWQRLANGGEYEAALFDLAQAGGFESVLVSSNAEQLMLLADIARATGQRQRAITALRRVVSEFPSEPVAPLAAWSLGRALEKAGDNEGANAAFAAYRSLSPQGDFAEDALVRQLRTAVQRREREVAQELAAQYSTDFPQGRRRDEVARWMGMLGASAETADADAGVPEVDFPPLDEVAE